MDDERELSAGRREWGPATTDKRKRKPDAYSLEIANVEPDRSIENMKSKHILSRSTRNKRAGKTPTDRHTHTYAHGHGARWN